MRLIVCLLCASLTRAATLESTARPASLNIVLTPKGEASAGLLSLSCKGYSYVGGYKPDVDVNLEPPLPRPRVTTEFLGADPGCLVRTGPVLPGTRNFYAGPGLTQRQEGAARYARVDFQNVWPGVDVTLEVEGRRARMIYSLDSPDRASAIRLRHPSENFLDASGKESSIDDIRFFGHDTLAKVRADEMTLHGLNPIALDIRYDDPTPFRMRQFSSNPVRITLEGEFPEQPIGPTASLLGPRGSFFETTGPVIRKYGHDGVLLFETELAGGDFTELVAAPDGSLYAIGNTLTGDFPSTPGAAQTRFSGVFLYQHPRGNLQLGDLNVTCLDGGTGRIVYSTYLGGAFEETGRFRGIDASGNLHLFVTSTSPDFLRKGNAIAGGCTPRMPVGFGGSGLPCPYVVLLSAEDGSVVYSKPLPATTIDAHRAPDGTLYTLRHSGTPTLLGIAAVEVFDPSGQSVPGLAFVLPERLSSVDARLTVDTTQGFWVSARSELEGRLFHRGTDAVGPRPIVEFGFKGHLFPLPNGGILFSSQASASRDGEDRHDQTALMRRTCPFGSGEIAVVDAAGNVNYSTFIPDTIEPPSPSAPPQLQGRAILWGRHRLDLDAPPKSALICAGGVGVSPGSIFRLTVRGVQDDSPFVGAMRPGEIYPTEVRGLSISIDGTPAAIVGLDREYLTAIVPAGLPTNNLPRSVQLSVSYRGRKEVTMPLIVWFFGRRIETSSLGAYLTPVQPVLLQGRYGTHTYASSNNEQDPARAGDEVKVFLTGVGPTNPPLPDFQIPANADATPTLPFHLTYNTGQEVPITYFPQVPGHPPGVFELRFRLPAPAPGTREIYISIGPGPTIATFPIYYQR